MWALLRVRCGMSKRDALRTTLPEAQALLAEIGEVDGSREISNTLISIAKALTGVKDGPDAPKPSTPAQSNDSGGVLIPELQAMIDERAKALAAQMTDAS